jgi:hypothetical protein
MVSEVRPEIQALALYYALLLEHPFSEQLPMQIPPVRGKHVSRYVARQHHPHQ